MTSRFEYKSPSVYCAAPDDVGRNATELADLGWDVVQVIPPAAQAHPFPIMAGVSLFQQGAYTFLIRRTIHLSTLIDYAAEEARVQ
jgi:hypothetical protein